MPDEQSYVSIIRRVMPDLEINTVRTNNDGLMNAVVIVNEDMVCRFPRDDGARSALDQEIRILELVRRQLSIPVPCIEQRHAEFIAYRLIRGEALNRNAILRAGTEAQHRLAGQIGHVLAELHSIPRDAIDHAGIAASSAARSRETWVALYQEAERVLFPLLITHGREWVSELFEPVIDGRLDVNYTPVLTHGDVGPYHLLYDPDAMRLTGVIDFGVAGLGDPANDLANLISGLGESIVMKMEPAYPTLRSYLDRARFMAGSVEVQWLLNGLRSNDPSWFAAHIGFARDVGPID